jgi:hypothetical protein
MTFLNSVPSARPCACNSSSIRLFHIRDAVVKAHGGAAQVPYSSVEFGVRKQRSIKRWMGREFHRMADGAEGFSDAQSAQMVLALDEQTTLRRRASAGG